MFIYILYLGNTRTPTNNVYTNGLFGGGDRSIFYPAIINGSKELIEYLQDHVPNSAELLLEEMKRDNCGPLEDSIAMNNLTNLVNFCLNLRDSSPREDNLPDSVITGICMR